MIVSLIITIITLELLLIYLLTTMDSQDIDKVARYQDVVTKATTDVWTHMLSRVEDIPDEFSDLTEGQLEILMDIEAVEAEWILDEDMRRTVSIIQWSDDDEEEA